LLNASLAEARDASISRRPRSNRWHHRNWHLLGPPL